MSHNYTTTLSSCCLRSKSTVQISNFTTACFLKITFNSIFQLPNTCTFKFLPSSHLERLVDPTMIQDGSTINRRWFVKEKIGSFGDVSLYKACRKFKLKEKVSRRELIVKVSRKINTGDNFQNEDEIFKRIIKNTRHMESTIVPNYYYSYRTDKEDIVVFKMTGISLFSYCKNQQGLLPTQQVIHIFLKALACIQKFHSLGIAHRNIIPQLIWIAENGHDLGDICFIDFMNAKMSHTDRGGKDIDAISFQDRKNDLEMLCHCMMYISDGCPSWGDVTVYKHFPDCCTCVENEENRNMCPQCEVCFCYPRCFRNYLFYLRSVSELSGTEYRVLQKILRMDVTEIMVT